MAIDYQLNIKKAVEEFCNNNPDMVFSIEENMWLRFNGKLWEDATDEFEEIILKLWEEHGLMYEVHRKNLEKSCKFKKRLSGSINLDSDLLINTPDGVIDAARFFELCDQGKNPKELIESWIRPHVEFKEKYLTSITGASYRVNSMPPQKFLDFISEFLQHDEETINYFLRFLAYCLMGLISEQYFHVLFGIGRNGKSTLLLIIAIVFGTYLKDLSNEVITKGNDDEKAKRQLFQNRHKRLILFNEQQDNFKLNNSLVKLLTGDDNIPVRVNGKDREFKMQSKILLNTNSLPALGSSENRGIWDRLRIISTQPPISEESREEQFFRTILPEKDQIFTYLIDRFLMDYHNNGLRKMTKMMEFTKDFKKFSENPVAYFFEKTITLANVPLNKAQWVRAHYLYGQYCQFHLLVSRLFDKILKIRSGNESHMLLVETVTETAFSLKMQKLGAYEHKSNSRYYKNIYFSSERVYSEFGERVEPDELVERKAEFRNNVEEAYLKKRQMDEAASPYVQTIAMINMPSGTENHFEEPKPNEITSAVSDWMAWYIFNQRSPSGSDHSN